MEVIALIEKELKVRGKVTSGKIAKLANISRQAAHGQLAKLVKEKKLLKVGTTRKSYYIPFSSRRASKIAKETPSLQLRLLNKGLEEDQVLKRVALAMKSFNSLPENTRDIFNYAFSEILNNAIEHSQSKKIEVKVLLSGLNIVFEIIDHGVGLYNNLRGKYGLKSDLEAVQELLKGKRSTDPKRHSGEGIFFTSKIADIFTIESSKTKLLIDNPANDTLVEEIPQRKGTKVIFQTSKRTKKDLTAIFNEYTDEEYKFSKTKVIISLYAPGADYISRSQARRVVFGMDKFKQIVLDFKKIKGIGQGFADEIFRVFAGKNPSISLTPINANPAVLFMINRTKAF